MMLSRERTRTELDALLVVLGLLVDDVCANADTLNDEQQRGANVIARRFKDGMHNALVRAAMRRTP